MSIGYRTIYICDVTDSIRNWTGVFTLLHCGATQTSSSMELLSTTGSSIWSGSSSIKLDRIQKVDEINSDFLLKLCSDLTDSSWVMLPTVLEIRHYSFIRADMWQELWVSK